MKDLIVVFLVMALAPGELGEARSRRLREAYDTHLGGMPPSQRADATRAVFEDLQRIESGVKLAKRFEEACKRLWSRASGRSAMLLGLARSLNDIAEATGRPHSKQVLMLRLAVSALGLGKVARFEDVDGATHLRLETT